MALPSSGNGSLNDSTTRAPVVAPETYTLVSFEPTVEADTLTRTQAVAAPLDASIGIVATGDNHLSPILAKLSPQRRTERRERLRRGFSAAVSYAIEHGARLFLIAGDLFDTPSPSNLERAFVASELARLRSAGITSVAVSGAHDTPRLLGEPGAESPLRIYDALDGLDYFSPENSLMPRLYSLGGLRVALIGLPGDPNLPPGADPLAGRAIEDPGNVLGNTDVALLLAHAGVEGASAAGERETRIKLSGLATLPANVRLLVAGQAHQFSHQRVGDREVVTPGATERMDFETPPETAGFVWIELGAKGVTAVRHVPVPEQPRADIVMPTEGLLPREAADLDASTPTGQIAAMRDTMPMPTRIRKAITPVCTPETMVRLRLVGKLPRADLRRLGIREILRAGRQAFSFELDTSALSLVELGRIDTEQRGALSSPADEIEALVAERASALSGSESSELRAAADLLMSRLQSYREAGQ